MGKGQVRRPAVAGQFYPAEPATLRRMAREFVDASRVEAAPDRVTTVVAPHAGYIYSGPTAGFAYARVEGKQPKRIILLGCSHRYYIDTASVYTRGVFETPLGVFPIDEPFADSLAVEFGSTSDEPHLLEHALEVQLPFLAVTVGLVPVVPVLLGGPAGSWHAEAGERLAELVDPSDLVVASTDLSHYLDEKRANAIDKRSIDAVLGKDWREFAEGVENQTCSMCGAAAVTAAMAFAKARNAESWQLLDYRTSGAASGDFRRVVGYAAISMEQAA